MNLSEVNKIIKEFNKKNVDYVILRNYENLEKEKDLDILIGRKDGFKVTRILKKNGFGKGFFKTDRSFDVKTGCLEFSGYFIEDSKKVLSKKKLYKNFYILSEGDEIKHLTLKSLGNGFSKPKYVKKINNFIQGKDSKKIEDYLINLFGELGEELFKKIKTKNYEEAAKMKRDILSEFKSPYRKFLYFLNRLFFPCLKR